MSEIRCLLLRCRNHRPADRPLCWDHWRLVPVDLRDVIRERGGRLAWRQAVEIAQREERLALATGGRR